MPSLLLSFGLNPSQCVYLWEGFEGGIDLVRPAVAGYLSAFVAIPKNRDLPGYPEKSYAPELWEDTASNADWPSAGIFHFDMRIWLGERTATIERAFKHWLREHKKLYGLSYLRPDKDLRGEVFQRDLVVFAMSRPPRWSIEDIEIQLRYMGLPPLIQERADPKSNPKYRKRTSTSDPKAARREIVRRFTLLLRSVQKSVLFEPHERNSHDGSNLAHPLCWAGSRSDDA